MKQKIMHLVATLAALFLSTSTVAQTQPQVKLSNDVFVERQIQHPDGTTSLALEQPKLVVPGDNLVFVVKFKNAGTQLAENFTVTNPVPKAVAFNGTADGGETVSVDGGTSWGPLATLRITDADGSVRPARVADVTHIKWNLNQSLPAGSEGKVIFRGIVR